MLLALIWGSYTTSWWTFTFTYAVLYAIGIGISYWPPVICAWEWFPERKGLISGLIIGCYGLGAFFYNFIT